MVNEGQSSAFPGVVVTGLGMVTSLGFGLEHNWNRLLAGETEIRNQPASRFPMPIELPVRMGAAVEREALAEEVRKRVPRSVWNTSDAICHIWLVAALEALQAAGLPAGKDQQPENGALGNPRRTGIFVGCGAGAHRFAEDEYTRVYTAEKAIQRDISRFAIPMYMTSSLPGQLAIQTGIKGPAMTVSTACASGANALLLGLEAMRAGRIDRAVVGGADLTMSAATVKGFYKLGALATPNDDHPATCRPFDTRRNGLVLGEGAAALVLERADKAAERRATPLASVLGGATMTEANHLLAPREDGVDMEDCIREALEDAGVAPGRVRHVYAHGTGTQYNDACEANALARLFPHRPTVSASKELLGHTLGAAGAIDAVLAVQGLRQGRVVPLTRLTHPDPECPVNAALDSSRPELVQSGNGAPTVLVDSFAFGGHNVALLFGAAS